MSRFAYHRLSQALLRFLPLTACLLCAAGCHNTCVSGVLNSPGGSTVNVKVASPPPSCTLTTANGIVHLEIGSASVTASSPDASGTQISHLFVTLAGADMDSDGLASDESSIWQSLAPQLQAHPFQVDLLSAPEVNELSAPFPDAVLPAGEYRQIRLRLAVPLGDGPVLEANRCGVGALHCAVMSDGRVQPLALSPSALTFRILSEKISGGGLYVPPDGAVRLRIEFDRDRSSLWFTGDSLLLSPVVRMSVQQPARSGPSMPSD